MDKREKVITGIEACMNHDHPEHCNECYLDGPGFGIVCREMLMHDALALLKEQEAVEPRLDDAWTSPIFVCGDCGTCLFKVGDYKSKYCSECGRAVKWDV